MPTRLFMLTLLISLQASLLGCKAGSGEGLDENGNPIEVDNGQEENSEDNSDTITSSSLEPTLESIQENIFTPICAKCHKTGSPPQGLNLDSLENSFALLVDKEAGEVPELKRVSPGDPENSYLIQKLEGTASVGARMPLGLSPLPDEDIAVIKQWIISLAPNTSASSTRAARSLDLNAHQNRGKEICFDKAINPTTVYSTAVTVTGISKDSETTGPDFILVPDFDYQLTQISSACLSISFSDLVNPGNYEIQINSLYGTPILDVDGYMIDGDQDGYEGGSMALEVTVINGEIQ